jgi:hypothetical protein
MRNNLLIALFIFSFSASSHAMSLLGRLGIGMSKQLVTGMETLSFKIQRNRALAVGGLFGLQSNTESTNYAIGGKLYRLIYDEPQLNFYSAATGAFFSYQNSSSGETENGYQIEASFGTEFSFQGLESIGFSFEFGAGYTKYDGQSTFRTLGHNVVSSAVHFYL